MLGQQLQTEWRDRRNTIGIEPLASFSANGLVQGAGTILAHTTDWGTDPDLVGPRLIALLAVAHGRVPNATNLAHLAKASKHWCDGDAALAAMHLALSGFVRLRKPERDAKRLFLADRLLQLGLSPSKLLKVAHQAEFEPVLSKYSPEQPRVPAGNGRPSGQWTSGDSEPGGQGSKQNVPHDARPRSTRHQRQGRTFAGPANLDRPTRPPRPPRPQSQAPKGPPPTSRTSLETGQAATQVSPIRGAMAGAVAVRGGGAAIDLGSLSDVQLATVARWLTGLGEAAGAGASAAFAGFGLAMIPVNTGSGKWINLPGPGHVRLFYSHDEPGISLRYVTADGAAHELDLGPWPGGKYRDPTSGKVIARWVKVAGKGTLILAVGSLLNRKSKNGDLCPMPKKENHGTLGRAYEDYVKAYFNPGNPTPSGFGYQVPKIRNLNPVNLDDCQQSDPHNWAEYKGPGYEKHLIKNDPTWWGQEMGMIIQAEDEREAEMIAGRKNIYWFFDEPEVAAYMAPILQIINPDIHTIAFPMRPAR